MNCHCCCYSFQGKMQLFHKANAPLCFLFNALYQKDHNNVPCKYHPEPTAGSCCSCMLWRGYVDPQDGSLSAAAGQGKAVWVAFAYWWSATKELSKTLHHWKILQRPRFRLKLRHKIKPSVHRQGNQCSLVNSRKVHCGTHCRPDNTCWAKSIFELHFSGFSWGGRRDSRFFNYYYLLFHFVLSISLFLIFLFLI